MRGNRQDRTYIFLCNASSKYEMYMTGRIQRVNGRLTEAIDVINPLSPNSDQHQFSPDHIHTKSRDWVMRINKMIT